MPAHIDVAVRVGTHNLYVVRSEIYLDVLDSWLRLEHLLDRHFVLLCLRVRADKVEHEQPEIPHTTATSRPGVLIGARLNELMILSIALSALAGAAPSLHVGDGTPLDDPLRPVIRIERDSFTLRYYTATPCPTMVEVRQSDLPGTAYRVDKTSPAYGKAGIVRRAVEATGLHTVKVTGLKPGKRYFYRVYDPGVEPTSQEKAWGASDGYRREFAVSTLAPKGQKTIIHLPVKVLLMPNVVNVASAYGPSGEIAPKPPKITPEQIQRIKDEFAVSSRFFWVNSGMRLWVDYQFFVDERWQRWGPEPANAGAFYRGWPSSRSYAGQDFTPPGGGDFTILDTQSPLRVTKDPVVETRPYSGQIEMAWPRRWNADAKRWEFYNSGGGTYGVDQFPRGVPGRSQFLGGGDTAWLATHEFHHDLESHGEFSLSNREDDRIVFNHYGPRHRTVKPDGGVDEGTWTTSGRHGEHWDGMAFWDRALSDAQWLRIYFGYTTTVKDADEDGFPDDDRRLPLDERRFGSAANKLKTDGQMLDLEKVMLSTWVPGPLQPSWVKPHFQGIAPDPKTADSDRDGLVDSVDPYPLWPYEPLIYASHADVDGDASEWSSVPLAGRIRKGDIDLDFKQSHDDDAYYGLFVVNGPWKRIAASFDGEGLGIYSGVGVQGFELSKNGGDFTVRPTFGAAPGLKWKAREIGGRTVVEFSFPNRGQGIWYWNRGGRDIGSVINVFDEQNRAFSIYEPYRIFYARMLEGRGKAPMPTTKPSDISADSSVRILKPGDATLGAGANWVLEKGVLRYKGGEPESPIIITVPPTREFDLMAVVEAKSDGILGAFLPNTREIGAGSDYIGFVGGYGNASSRLRLFGQEAGDEPIVMAPGKHRIQLSRRQGIVWLLMDGKPVVWASDPNPSAEVTKLAILGGYNGEQAVHEVRIRT
jgi:hypothetical protein